MTLTYREKKRRLVKSTRRLQKAINKRIRMREERIFIENNDNINIFNYPYYKLKWKFFGLPK